MDAQGVYLTVAEVVAWIRARAPKAGSVAASSVVASSDSEARAIREQLRQACRKAQVRCIAYRCDWPDPWLKMSTDHNDRMRYLMMAGQPRDHAEEVPAHEWLDLEFARDEAGQIVDDLCRTTDGRVMWKSARFSESDVAAGWPEREAATSRTEITSSDSDQRREPRSRGGRPRRYDWDAFYREIIRRANTPDGLPGRAELTTAMKQWCSEQWGAEPADSYLREHIGKIYDELDRTR